MGRRGAGQPVRDGSGLDCSTFWAVQPSGEGILLAPRPNGIPILPRRQVHGWDAACVGMNRLPQRLSLPAQTVAILKEEIQAGRWCKWMPGEYELCRQLRVGRQTLRAALVQLQKEGWVRSRQGKRRQIVARQGWLAPAASGLVVLLTPNPMQLLRPFTVLWTNELREHLAEAGYNLE